MVALVTGAAGFLGRHVTHELSRHGLEVVPAGRPTNEIPSVGFDEMLTRCRPSLVVHCAGPASVPASIENPQLDRQGSVEVTSALVESLQRLASTPRLILVSSAAVYGQPVSLPVAETAEPAPISPYGRHRLETEEVVRGSGIPSTTVRVFSAYGDGLRRQLLWDIATAARESGVVELWGTGEETRDFVHAKDVASAIAQLGLDNACTETLLNVGSGSETTIREIATLLLAALGADHELHFRGVGRQGDPQRWRADVSRLIALGWRPAVTLEEGIASYARWFGAGAP